ncbi:hypothetical protein U1Q18_025084, partial [Sarracenia purpurea var. burkii]
QRLKSEDKKSIEDKVGIKAAMRHLERFSSLSHWRSDFRLRSCEFFNWLLQFSGFKERLLADDLFFAKVAMECGVGIFTKTTVEYERQRKDFFKELEIVFADVVYSYSGRFPTCLYSCT